MASLVKLFTLGVTALVIEGDISKLRKEGGRLLVQVDVLLLLAHRSTYTDRRRDSLRSVYDAQHELYVGSSNLSSVTNLIV
jgi:hypothetical protein